MLEHALSNVDFSVGTGIYILPSNLNLNIVKTKGYDNGILVSDTGIKISSNRDINRDRKKLPVAKPDVPETVISVARHDPGETTIPHNLKILTKAQRRKTSHDNFDCGDWPDCLPFLVENRWHHYYYSQLVVLRLMHWPLAAPILYLVGSQTMVRKNAKDMI